MGELSNELILPAGIEHVEPIELQEEPDRDPTGNLAEAPDPDGHDGEDDDLTIREDEPVPGRVAFTVIQRKEGIELAPEGTN